MKRRILASSLALSLAFLGACSKGAAPASPAAAAASKDYPGHGVLRGFQSQGKVVVISHDAMPGLMEAMTMGYELKDPALAQGLKPGDTVDFTLNVAGDAWTVTAMKKAR